MRDWGLVVGMCLENADRESCKGPKRMRLASAMSMCLVSVEIRVMVMLVEAKARGRDEMAMPRDASPD